MKYLKTYNESFVKKTDNMEYYIISYNSDEDKFVKVISKIKELGLDVDEIVKHITPHKVKYYKNIIICKKTGESVEDYFVDVGFSLITDYSHLTRRDVYDVLEYEKFVNGDYDEDIKTYFNANKMGLL